MEKADLTVVILTHNGADLLPLSLAHLELQTYPSASFEVVIVDNASEDQTPQVIERFATGSPVRTRWVRLNKRRSRARARNEGLKQAQGQWVLFLDEDLLAGSHLVESHMDAHRGRDGHCAIVGHVSPHPQLDAQTFTRRYWLSPRGFVPNQPLSFLDWRAHNLSLPRDLILKAGGFGEDTDISGMEEVELGYRLERMSGVRGFYCEEACGFRWRPASLDAEVERHYRRGYSLYAVNARIECSELRERYRRDISPWRGWCARGFSPMGKALCPLVAGDTALFRFLSLRLLRAAFRNGYRDAARGRPPRPR